jgi:DNA-binding MarR family transcriptional regulator
MSTYDRADAASDRSARPWPVAYALITYPPATLWRRRLGPLAWVALEHLALSSQRTDQGWIAPVGVRDVAEGLGVTKDTAARAVAALGAAGLVILSRVETAEGRRRSGYLLHLPDQLRLIDCPAQAVAIENPPTGRPERKWVCPGAGPRERIPHRDTPLDRTHRVAKSGSDGGPPGEPSTPPCSDQP